MSEHYDVLIVGAGVAGSALAHALSVLRPENLRPLRIALVERSLAEPNTMVGELLQPAGMHALRKLRLESCVKGIGAIPVHGYCVVHSGQNVPIPYPNKEEGRSFHHGRFVMALREKAKQAKGVDVIEATVSSNLVECPHTGRILGIRARRDGKDEEELIFANLVVIADGRSSNLRRHVFTSGYEPKPLTKSHFVGVILKGQRLLPMYQHGTVVLVPGSGPVLLYQIEDNDTRVLIDVKTMPRDVKGHIITNILPHLPPSVHVPLQDALEKERPRSMPNSFLPGAPQGNGRTKEGIILIGDAWNMRHPLTGAGMTVALNDVVALTDYLINIPDFSSWENIAPILPKWHWSRKPLAGTINVLSVALYDLFGAQDDSLDVLRTGCFKYFELGGECVNGPVSLLSGLAPRPAVLFWHFFSVAFYSIWVLFTHPRAVPDPDPSATKPVLQRPSVDEYPYLFLKSFSVFWTACVVFLPLMWTEIKWY